MHGVANLGENCRGCENQGRHHGCTRCARQPDHLGRRYWPAPGRQCAL